MHINIFGLKSPQTTIYLGENHHKRYLDILKIYLMIYHKQKRATYAALYI